jgi:hypothetical protein
VVETPEARRERLVQSGAVALHAEHQHGHECGGTCIRDAELVLDNLLAALEPAVADMVRNGVNEVPSGSWIRHNWANAVAYQPKEWGG